MFEGGGITREAIIRGAIIQGLIIQGAIVRGVITQGAIVLEPRKIICGKGNLFLLKSCVFSVCFVASFFSIKIVSPYEI